MRKTFPAARQQRRGTKCGRGWRQERRHL